MDGNIAQKRLDIVNKALRRLRPIITELKRPEDVTDALGVFHESIEEMRGCSEVMGKMSMLLSSQIRGLQEDVEPELLRLKHSLEEEIKNLPKAAEKE